MLTGMVSSLQKQTQSVAMRKKTYSDYVIRKYEINDLPKESTHYRYWLTFLVLKKKPGATKTQKSRAIKSYDYSKTIRRVREKKEIANSG